MTWCSNSTARNKNLTCLVALLVVPCAIAAVALDPAAWGSNHVGQPVPMFDDGNTCLFCHRTAIGYGWQTNKHATTLRPLGDESDDAKLQDKAQDAEFVLGRVERLRFLKTAPSYGTYALLDASWSPKEKVWKGNASWNEAAFGAKCAGCHASAVDSVAKTFQTPSLDCHTCHGLAVTEHTHDGSLMLLSPKAATPAEVEISICGSCHLRGGKSKSSNLPFPNNFVPGDNLFKDFSVDLSEKTVQDANARDLHIVQNARAVVIDGDKSVVCGTCHDIHKESSAKHVTVKEQPLCFACHEQGQPMKTVRTADSHSETCEY